MYRVYLSWVPAERRKKKDCCHPLGPNSKDDETGSRVPRCSLAIAASGYQRQGFYIPAHIRALALICTETKQKTFEVLQIILTLGPALALP